MSALIQVYLPANSQLYRGANIVVINMMNDIKANVKDITNEKNIMRSRFEVPRTSNFFPGLRGFCAERSSSIAPRARRGIATAGHMNLSSIVALSGADFACAPDSFMSRLDGIQVLQAGKVKDRGRMQFRRQRRGGFCEPPRLRMIMERI